MSADYNLEGETISEARRLTGDEMQLVFESGTVLNIYDAKWYLTEE